MHLGPTALAVLSECDSGNWVCDTVLRNTDNEPLASFAGWLAEKPLQIAAILAVAWVADLVLRRVIERGSRRMVRSADRLGGYMPASEDDQRAAGRSDARAATLSSISRSIATSIVVVLAVGAVLSVLGVSLAALFASAGVIGVALGFGAQTLVRDVLAGWFILVEDRYGVGDTIDAGAPAEGVVERVTLRSTRLRDVNGTVWHVANGEILRVGNMSQNWSRAVVDVTVAPSADVDLACRVLGVVGAELAGDTTWGTRMTGEPDVFGVHLIDPTGVTLRVVCQTEPASQFQVEREFRRRVLRAFDAEHIELATVPGFGARTQGPPTA